MRAESQHTIEILAVERAVGECPVPVEADLHDLDGAAVLEPHDDLRVANEAVVRDGEPTCRVHEGLDRSQRDRPQLSRLRPHERPHRQAHARKDRAVGRISLDAGRGVDTTCWREAST